MINLRPYQENTINGLRKLMKVGNKKLIMCAPTGAGKTIMFTHMISESVKKNKKCLILTHRAELLTQAGGSLEKFQLIPQFLNAKTKIGKGLVTVGMAQTLKRRLDKVEYQEWLKSIDIVIVDEAHTQDSDKILEMLSNECFIIGATATPFREHNKKQLCTIYSDIVEEVTIKTLINDGFLATPSYWGVPNAKIKNIRTKGDDYDVEAMAEMFSSQKLYRGVYTNYIEKCPGKKAIIFAPNVESSIELTNDFLNNGLPIRHIDANTPKSVREETLKWFKETPGALLSNVGILNAGFDEPSIEVVILYRATKSISLYLQMCGRGSRVIPGVKENFMILDFGENISEHGYWHDEREWSLETIKKRKSKKVAPEKNCPECDALIPARIMVCPYCQCEIQKSMEEQDEIEFVNLVKMMDYHELVEVSKNATFKQLEVIKREKGYKDQWIYWQLKTPEDIEAYRKYKGYHPKWVDHQMKLKNLA